MRFEQMGAFGTGLLFIDYDVKETIRYKCIHLKDVVLGQNHQGIVNRVDRVIHMTVLDIIAAFGEGIKLSEKMQAVLGTLNILLPVSFPRDISTSPASVNDHETL
jgi:hypothetical protein